MISEKLVPVPSTAWYTNILMIIQSNSIYYILVGAIFVSLFAFIQLFSKKKRIAIISIVLANIAAFAFPIFVPYQITVDEISSSPSSIEPESLTEYRYDLYDDNEVMARINAINDDLSNEGKYINPDKLKAFIYAMNGDYSLCDSGDILNDVWLVIANVNIDFINILREGFDNRWNNPVTTISSLADIFRDPMDYEMVLFWQTKYNQIYSEIYTQGPTEQAVHDLDEYCKSLYDTFLLFECVEIDGATKLSVYSISDEAEFGKRQI